MSHAAHRFSNDLRYRDGSHPSQTQLTPEYVLAPVLADIGDPIGLDPCTIWTNPVNAEVFYIEQDDGLSRSWHADDWHPSVFVNPPYSKAREPWVRRCIDAGARGQRTVLLIPAATDTRIFQAAASSASAIVFVKGRVKFGVLRPNRRQVAASHPSALIGWNTDLAVSSSLGLRLAACRRSAGVSWDFDGRDGGGR